jgi:hypothetical protein
LERLVALANDYVFVLMDERVVEVIPRLSSGVVYGAVGRGVLPAFGSDPGA